LARLLVASLRAQGVGLPDPAKLSPEQLSALTPEYEAAGRDLGKKTVAGQIQVSTVAEVAAAAEALLLEQRQELLLFLVARLHADGAGPRK